MKLKTFTIQRDKWARGGKNGKSALLNSRGAMCCLGFFSLARGASKEEILNKVAPACLLQGNKKWRKLFKGVVRQVPGLGKHTKLGYDLMSTNDNSYLGEVEREFILAKMFAKLGWKVKYE